MSMQIKFLGIALILSAASFAWTPPLHAAEIPMTEGVLVRSESDPKVYLIEKGQKRWIGSADAFIAQGFHWTDIVIMDASALAALTEGPPVTEASRIVLPGDTDSLPDLAPLGAGNFHLTRIGGRAALKFTAAFSNLGKGPFELFTQPGSNQPADNTYHTAYQHITRPDGSVRDKIVGSLLFHKAHDHYHHADFADYKLEMVRPAPGSSAMPAIITAKTTYCMRDDLLIAPDLPNAPKQGVFAGCGQMKQGVSVGWTDIYSYTLPDQYFDVQDLPPGTYKVVFDVDPRGHFLEGRTDNNVSVSLVELNVEKGIVKVLLDGGTFTTTWNRYTDGMLVRGEGDSRVYVIRNGKKRWLRTEDVFNSYGYAWPSVYVMPQAVINAIPQDTLVRLKGTPRIYLLNGQGYRRHLLSPTVLASYGSNFAEINQTEFDSYPETNLIMRSGERTVYAIENVTRRELGTIDALPGLGYDPAQVHVVSDADFHAYAGPQTPSLPAPDPGAAQIIAEHLEVPWDIAFLPDGDLLVTERPGTLRRLGAHPATIAIPDVPHFGEGGLMGIALHPQFADNNYIYLYFTIQQDNKKNRIARFKLDGDRLTDEKIIIDGIPSAIYHDGGQIAFGPDGMLYATTGDSEVPASAQDRNSLGGKTLRLTPDGGIPADNPFGNAVWSWGHRNAQGLAWDDRGRLWETEHGRSGALSGLDELNLIDKGNNYGWPAIQGDQTKAGMFAPIRHSGPDATWAPSGLVYADGSLFFAGLRGSAIYEAVFDQNGNITSLRTHLKDAYGRLRAMVLGPDGYLYVTTSNRDDRGVVREGDDKIIRMSPEYVRAH